MLTMNGGVYELYFVLVDSPDIMYTRMDFNFYYKDIGYCDVYKADENNSELSRKLTAEPLESMGVLKLKYDYGFDVKDFDSFTDADGNEWRRYDIICTTEDDGGPHYRLESEPTEDKICFSQRYYCIAEPHKTRLWKITAENQNDEWKIIEKTELPKTPMYDSINGEVLYFEDADTSQEPFADYHFTYVHTGGEAFRLDEGEKYSDYTIGYARHVFNIYKDEFVEWGNIYAFEESVTLNGKLKVFSMYAEDEPELFLTITVDENPGFPFPYSLYWDEAYEEIMINLGKPEDYADNAEVMDFIDNCDTYSDKKFSVAVSNLHISWIYSGPIGQSDGKIEKLNGIIDM